MPSQGLPGQPRPFGSSDDMVRRIEGLDAKMRELGPSIAKSFQSTVADIQAQQAILLSVASRLESTNGAISYTVDLNTNSSGLETDIITGPPPWATTAAVSTSMYVLSTSGTTTRVADYICSAFNAATGSPPQMAGRTDHFEATGTDLKRLNPGGTVIVPECDVFGLTLRTQRVVKTPGTGALNMRVYFFITWLD